MRHDGATDGVTPDAIAGSASPDESGVRAVFPGAVSVSSAAAVSAHQFRGRGGLLARDPAAWLRVRFSRRRRGVERCPLARRCVASVHLRPAVASVARTASRGVHVRSGPGAYARLLRAQRAARRVRVALHSGVRTAGAAGGAVRDGDAAVIVVD
eukprot:ctg_670.g291